MCEESFLTWRFDAMYFGRKLHFGGTCHLHLQGGSIRRVLTLILLTWRIGWAPSNASKWQMGFNSAFKGLRLSHQDYTLTILTNLLAKIMLVRNVSDSLSASIVRVWRDEWWKYRDNCTVCHGDLRLDIWLLCVELNSRLLGRSNSANR